MSKIGNIVSNIFNCPVYVLSESRYDSRSVNANCLVGGHFCHVSLDDDRLTVERDDSETARIKSYAEGIAAGFGIYLDSVSPFEELAGYLRLDVKCSGGNKPCGKTCIPQRYKCKVKGAGEKDSKKNKKLKSGGGIGDKGKAAAGIGGLSATGAYLESIRKKRKAKREEEHAKKSEYLQGLKDKVEKSTADFNAKKEQERMTREQEEKSRPKNGEGSYDRLKKYFKGSWEEAKKRNAEKQKGDGS